jgi:hypothetical protein
MTANLEYFEVKIGNRKSEIAALLVKDAVAGVVVKKTNTVITAKLKDIVISDPNPVTIHPDVSNLYCFGLRLSDLVSWFILLLLNCVEVCPYCSLPLPCNTVLTRIILASHKDWS